MVGRKYAKRVHGLRLGALSLLVMMLLIMEGGIASNSVFAALPLPTAQVPVLGKTYITGDQLVSLNYPDTWVIKETVGEPNRISIASSQAALDLVDTQSNPKLTSGQIAIQLYYLPAGATDFLGFDTTTSEKLMSTIVHSKVWVVASVQLGKIGKNDAARVYVKSANLSGAYFAIINGDLAILAGVFTAPDEVWKGEPILEAIALSIRRNSDSAASENTNPVATQTDIHASNGMDIYKTFISSDKSLSVRYPSEWVIQSTNPREVSIGNSARIIDQLNSPVPSKIASGDAGIQFNYVLVENIPPSVDVSGDPTKFLGSIFAQVPSTVKLGKIEASTIGALDTAWVTIDTKDVEFVVYAFYIDKTPVFAICVTAVGEWEQFKPIFEAMMLSVQIKALSQ